MDKEEIKSKIDLNRIEVKPNIIYGEDFGKDYLIDDKGNYLMPVSPLEFKLIEKIKDLELRIKKLEEKLK